MENHGTNKQGGDTDSPLTRVGIALAEPVRQRVLLALLDGPARPGELLDRLGVAKTNLSNHLACLRGCGLILGESSGRTITYRLVSDDLEHALRDLLRLESRLCEISDSTKVPALQRSSSARSRNMK